jgi:hypothetical protein
MIRHLALCAFAAAGTYWATSDVNAAIVDFSAIAQGDGTAISQAFGDTAEVNFTYSLLQGGNNWGQAAAAAAGSVSYWNGGYSFDDAIYSQSNGNKVQVKIDAAPGFKLTSVDFGFGGYFNQNRSVDYKAFDSFWTEILGQSSFAISGSTGGTVLSFVQDLSSIIIQFGDDWNVGLNSISFETAQDTSSVPIPAGIILAGTGLLGLAGTGRLKSRKN